MRAKLSGCSATGEKKHTNDVALPLAAASTSRLPRAGQIHGDKLKSVARCIILSVEDQYLRVLCIQPTRGPLRLYITVRVQGDGVHALGSRVGTVTLGVHVVT